MILSIDQTDDDDVVMADKKNVEFLTCLWLIRKAKYH